MVLSPDAPNSPATINFPGQLGDGGSPNFGGTIALNGRDLVVENTSHLNPGVITRLYNLSSLISGDGNVRVRTGTNPDGTFNGGPRARIMNTANTWTGDLFVETGMIQIGNGNVATAFNAIPNTAVVHMSAGTRMGMGSSGDTFAGLTGGAAAGELPQAQVNPNVSGSGTSRITLAGADDYVFGGTLANESTTKLLALTKAGTGSQTLGGDCTFTGSTLITGGTLAINGAYASAITMSAGTVLQGTPTSTAALAATAAGAVVSPGNSTGAMTFASANLSTGGILEIEVDDKAAPACDSIHATGVLNLTGTTLNLSISRYPAAPAYVIASYGTLTGTFGAVNGLPSGYELVYDYNDGIGSNHIALVSATANPYTSWLAAYPTITGADRYPDADYDQDGIANGIEFVIGSDPSTVTSTGLPAGSVAGGNFDFTFKRTDASKAYAVTVEHGTTLATWPGQTLVPTTATAGPPVNVLENGSAADDITVSIPTAGDTPKIRPPPRQHPLHPVKHTPLTIPVKPHHFTSCFRLPRRFPATPPRSSTRGTSRRLSRRRGGSQGSLTGSTTVTNTTASMAERPPFPTIRSTNGDATVNLAHTSVFTDDHHAYLRVSDHFLDEIADDGIHRQRKQCNHWQPWHIRLQCGGDRLGIRMAFTPPATLRTRQGTAQLSGR